MRGLVIPNERRVTTNGAFSGATLRAGAIFAARVVVDHLCRITTPRSLSLAGSQKWSPAVMMAKRQHTLVFWELNIMTMEITSRITTFLQHLGIEVLFSSLNEAIFLPGLLIRQGKLIVDLDKLLYPGDLLHEAGHIAVTAPDKRTELTGDVHRCGHGPGEEMAAIAWSWAASLKLDIAANVLFHPDGYKGASQHYIDVFESGQGFGFPLLVYWGLTNPPGQPKGYPAMSKWIR